MYSSASFEINLSNPGESQKFIETPDHLFYGLISIPKNCNENRYFGVRGGSTTTIIELDFENRKIVGDGPYIGWGPYDGATSYDIGHTRGPVIDSITFNGICNAGSSQFDMQIHAGIAEELQLTYTLNANPSNHTGFFPGQPFQEYLVNVSAENGCVADSSFTLVPVALGLQANLQPTTSCTQPNGVIELEANGNYQPFQYKLQTNPWGKTHRFDSLSSGIYPAMVKNRLGCVVTDTFTVSNLAWIGRVQQLLPKPSFCTINNGTLSIAISGNNFNVLTSINGSTPANQFQYSNLAPGQYTLSLFDGNNCRFDTLFSIEQQLTNRPAWKLQPVNQMCLVNNGSIAVNLDAALRTQFRSSLNGSPLSSTWLYTQLAPGMYRVSLQDSLGCSWTDSVLIQPYQQPLAKTDSSTLLPNCDEPKGGRITVQLSGGHPPYTFIDSAGQTAGTNSLFITGLQTGIYKYQVKNADGCAEPDLLFNLPFNQTGRCDFFYVPNAFTPNADGLNDKLTPQYSLLYKEVTFRIFNRYGESIYEHRPGRNGWDGNYKGKAQPASTYLWSASYLDIEGKPKKIKGSFVLIR